MKHRHLNAVGGMTINLIFVALSVFLVAKFHFEWETANIAPEDRLLYGEKLLRIACYQVIPAYAIVMSLSAFVFWLLRKD
jgi:hypothetical protein